MTQSEALDKIRKLLRPGRAGAEADTAAILAAALAARHGIDIAAIDVAEEAKRNEITQRLIGTWGKVPTEVYYSVAIVKSFFEVHAITLQDWAENVVLVGTAWHLDIAEYVLKFLVKGFRWQWNRKRGRCRDRKQFLRGCYIGLHSKLGERFKRPEGGLALEVSLSAKRQAYMDEHWPNSKTVENKPAKKSSAAANRGYFAGREIEIRPGVKAGAAGDKQGQLEFGGNGRLLTNGN